MIEQDLKDIRTPLLKAFGLLNGCFGTAVLGSRPKHSGAWNAQDAYGNISTVVDPRILVHNQHPSAKGAMARYDDTRRVPGFCGKPCGMYDYAQSICHDTLIRSSRLAYSLIPGVFEMPRSVSAYATFAVTARMANPEIWSKNMQLHILETFDSFMETADIGNAFIDVDYQKEVTKLRKAMRINRSNKEGFDYKFNGLSIRSVAAVIRVAALSGELKMLKMKLIAWVGALIVPWFSGSDKLRPPCQVPNDDRPQ